MANAIPADTRIYTEQNLFILQTDRTAYAIRLSQAGKLVHVYWGAKLPFVEDYPALPENWQFASGHARRHDNLAEFSIPGGLQEFEPCLRVLFGDGTRDLQLAYAGHSIENDGQELAIHLQDRHYPFEVVLRYQVFAGCDIINRRAEIFNTSNEAIHLEEALSASLPLPWDRGGAYRLTHLNGAWALETQISQVNITPGRKVLESRQHTSGHASNPFFAIDALGPGGQGATETEGEVWFGALHWTGNWKLVIEQVHSPHPTTRLAVGLNDWDFGWQLGPGQTFETPWLSLGYSGAGFSRMSHNLHRYQIDYLLPRRFATELRPVLYNSWEGVWFSVNEENQLDLARKAAELGAEYFVMDDGWFGERDNDTRGLGDWQPNPRKFPNGLKPLIEEVNRLGMKFGIWVEPEMVNPDSELYRAHPDWVYNFPTRERTTSRQQLILNMSRSDVQEWAFEWLDKLLTENNINYVKWDYNRAVSEPGWPEVPREHQREIWVRHIRALYRLVDRLRERHPEVLFEACSSGGARADFGSLTHFDHSHTSDNTDPLDRLPIQLGYSLVYAPKTMSCWVTHTDFNAGGYNLKYRFLSAFMGELCLSVDLNRWSEAERVEAAGYVAAYKEIRHLIQHGLMYRLSALSEPDTQAIFYVAPDGSEGVVLAFGHKSHFWRNPRRLCLPGLNPNALYTVSGDLENGEPGSMSGQGLGQRGILPKFDGHLSSVLIRVTRQAQL